MFFSIWRGLSSLLKGTENEGKKKKKQNEYRQEKQAIDSINLQAST